MKNILLTDYRIFFDTCSLMDPIAWSYIPNVLIPMLKEQGASVVVPLRVLDELRKLQSKEGETGEKASSGLSTVALMLSSGVLELLGNDERDTFADNYFLYTFIRLRLKHNLALVTQDKKLALDIHDLGNHRSVQGRKKILLLKIDNNELVEWNFNGNIIESEKKAKFEVCTQPRKKRVHSIPIGKVLLTGDVVVSQKYGKIVLGEQAVKTKSGYIFHCPGGLVCKVYNSKSLTTFQKQKIDKMMEVEVQIRGVCWPLDTVYTPDGNFVGYLMPNFAGGSLKETVFSKKSLGECFPGWTRLDLVDLCLTWLKIIIQLHDVNILVGDVNPSNIFVKSSKEVYVIETDMFQVEDFPCLQRNMDYVAPELRSYKPGTYLQTKEQEEYALATLLFMIILPGKHPFSSHDGSLTRLRSLKFPYPLGEKTNHNTPGKPWIYIWSNLSFRIKQLFSNVFREEQSIAFITWLKALYEYRHLLSNGYLNKELFPEKRKIINPCEVTCARCGIKETQEQKFIESIEAEGKNYYCENCLTEIRRGGKKEDQKADQTENSIDKGKQPISHKLLIQGA